MNKIKLGLLGFIGGFLHGLSYDFYKWRVNPGPFDIKVAYKRWLWLAVAGLISAISSTSVYESIS